MVQSPNPRRPIICCGKMKTSQRPTAQQQHRVSWVGGPGHYVVTPIRVEVELRLSWAVTIIDTKACYTRWIVGVNSV